MSATHANTDLMIIGAGAAGLMAGAMAGEVLDVDGPTGGFNLTAAFATARLAVAAITGLTATVLPPGRRPVLAHGMRGGGRSDRRRGRRS